jgi:hypothetical protein
MKFRPLILGFVLAVAGCASTTVLGPSPEAQIKTGAETVTAATTLATVALRDHKITVTQAKSYRNMLAAAGESLKDADTELVACRAATGSTAATSPDPCWAKVSDVVGIALTNITGVQRALAAK